MRKPMAAEKKRKGRQRKTSEKGEKKELTNDNDDREEEQEEEATNEETSDYWLLVKQPMWTRIPDNAYCASCRKCMAQRVDGPKSHTIIVNNLFSIEARYKYWSKLILLTLPEYLIVRKWLPLLIFEFHIGDHFPEIQHSQELLNRNIDWRSTLLMTLLLSERSRLLPANDPTPNDPLRISKRAKRVSRFSRGHLPWDHLPVVGGESMINDSCF